MTDKLQTLIEKLGEKHSECGSSICKKSILIGDVIIAIAEKYRNIEFPDEVEYKPHIFQYSAVPEIASMWCNLGKDKSLQEIGEMKEEHCFVNPLAGDGKPAGRCMHYLKNGICPMHGEQNQLKPQAQELINFLTELL